LESRRSGLLPPRGDDGLCLEQLLAGDGAQGLGGVLDSRGLGYGGSPRATVATVPSMHWPVTSRSGGVRYWMPCQRRQPRPVEADR